MRIVIDLQSSQCMNPLRGMGRYAMALAYAIAHHRGRHDVLIALNGTDTESVVAIRNGFSGVLPSCHFHVWNTGSIDREMTADTSSATREALCHVREAFLASLEPDLVLVPLHFEDQPTISSIGRLPVAYPVVALLHDAGPASPQHQHAQPLQPFADVRRADAWLGISGQVCQDVGKRHGLPADKVTDIAMHAAPQFCHGEVAPERARTLQQTFGLDRTPVVCIAGRNAENLNALILAWTTLPEPVRNQHQLLVLGELSVQNHKQILPSMKRAQSGNGDIVVASTCTETDLIDLYRLAALVLFPSPCAAADLTIQEVLCCGASALAAINESGPDRASPSAISQAIIQILANPGYRQELAGWQVKNAFGESDDSAWDNTALKAIHAFETLHAATLNRSLPSVVSPSSTRPLLALVHAGGISQATRTSLATLSHLLGDYYLVEPIAISRSDDPDVHAGQLERHARIIYCFAEPDRCDGVSAVLQHMPGISLLGSVSLATLYQQPDAVRLAEEIFLSHGYQTLHDLTADDMSKRSGDLHNIPCNLSLLQASLGVIVSSAEIIRVAHEWYADMPDSFWHVYSGTNEAGDGGAPPSHTAALHAAIERFYHGPKAVAARLPAALADLASSTKWRQKKQDHVNLAWAIARSIALVPRPRQLLVDISALVTHNAKTGIQRVVANILMHWLSSPPAGWRVEPVFASFDQGYLYARRFSCEFLGVPCPATAVDEPVSFQSGDQFFFLDLHHHVVERHQTFFQIMRAQGVSVKFIVYDVLPITLPQFFLPGVADAHKLWLKTISENDGCVCISQTVAHEVRDWMQDNVPQQLARSDFSIDWFHLGSNIDTSSVLHKYVPDLNDESRQILDTIRSRPTFLIVGTIEPRKGHPDILNAFDLLWQNDVAANLVFVGKPGWLMDDFFKRIASHPEAGRRFFWLNGISDEYLTEVYASASCLIIASQGEGFGLPVYEAAQHGLPIIARDIPVFRELAEEHAHYFSGHEPAKIAASIQAWIALHSQKQHPTPEKIKWLTWQQSAQQLAHVLLNKKCRKQEKHEKN